MMLYKKNEDKLACLFVNNKFYRICLSNNCSISGVKQRM